MPDVETQPAAPSPAAEPPKQETPQPAEPVSVPTNTEDYAKWRMTGQLPDKPSPEDPAPPRKPSVTPDPEPGAPHKRQGADARKEELNKEIRDLIAKRDELKREVETPPAKKDVQRESSPAQPAQPQPRQEPVEPNQDDFKTWEEYRAAEKKYFKDLANWEAGKRIEEYVHTVQVEAQRRELQVKLEEAKTRYSDQEAESKIFDTAQTVFQHQQILPVFKIKMGSSPVLVDVLYVVGSDQDEFKKFIDLAVKDPLEAMRKWYTVEALVTAELGKNGRHQPETDGTPPRGEDGKFVSAEKQPPARTQRTAPAPPTELGGNSSPPGDEADRALASGDVRGFMKARNLKDFARWKGNA